MRRRMTWLVAATTSAVVLAFVVPLCLLVRVVAEDRALAAADQETRTVALLVGGVDDPATLADLVAQSDGRSSASTSVLLPDGTVLGSPDASFADDPGVRRAVAGEAFTERLDDEGRIYVPVLSGADGTSVVRTTVSAADLHAGVLRAWSSISVLGLLLMLLALLIADRLGRRLSTPVTDLADVARRLGEGDLGARAAPRGPAETVELAETMNRLAERIVELLGAERTAVADLSHRLRTPVTALRLDVEAVADPELAPRLQGHLEQLQRSIDAIVTDARRPLHTQLSSVCDASQVVRDRAAFWTALAEDQGRPVEAVVPAGGVTVAVPAADLRDMVDVLVDNVFAHTPDGTGFAVRLLRDGELVVLEVADAGPGWDREDDHRGEGRTGTTGLGLQIVRRIAARAGGQLSLGAAGPGLVARVSLPVAPHTAVPPAVLTT